ncbi:biotin-dependent carboxyltransferase family protein [Aliagarivorans marinus]|uniref:5-oxoprolinase subunit C family protein n=1 Tax=Aliagarivorans marinus TaxID=561965 RepID=UPI0004016388|nr:biotin-dependent carboxyltransferase family protein [Aliagarivorans marinus]
MSGLEVVKPGVLSLLQDRGRYGVALQGLSSGGAMDLHAYGWVNRLLSNHSNAAVVELTMGNASFRATCDVKLALCGAEMAAKVEGVAQPNWQSFILRQGQLLELGYARTGLRAYLAVEGGFQVAKTLGSVATVTRNRLGGLRDGQPLQAGDRLPVAKQLLANFHSEVPKAFQGRYPEQLNLSLIESYQAPLFSESAKQAFYQGEYQVKPESDRMGIRLSGPVVSGLHAGLISEGIAQGAVQIPPDGQPIVLMNDRQTLGGYPKLGCVARLSLNALAQARPGTRIRFVPAELDEQSEKWRNFLRFFEC